MTHVCRPRCLLRLTPPPRPTSLLARNSHVAACPECDVAACPECRDLPQTIASLERTLGFRLVGPEELPHELPYTTAFSITVSEPGARS